MNVSHNVRFSRRSVLAGAALAFALAGSIAAAGPAGAAPLQPSFSCGTEETPTQAYMSWQNGVVTTAPAYATYSTVQSSQQPEWLASFDSMTAASPNDSETNWFTWDSDGGAPYVQQAFATPSSYIMEASTNQVSLSSYVNKWPALPTTVQVYKSAWDLIWALDPGAFTSSASCDSNISLDSDVGAVMYDNEDWTGTPAIEQQYPGYYVAMIAYYVHQYNMSDPPHPLKLFVAPSFDLTNGINTADMTTGSGASGYLAENIPELVSTPSTTWDPDQTGESGTGGNFGSYVPDDVDIQAQQDEPVVSSTAGCPSKPMPYWCIVDSAALQIHGSQADPGATLFAGLTTNNTGGNGTAASCAILAAAVASVQGTASGFWLNDPATSSGCMPCTGTYPDIADQSLNAIDTNTACA